MLELPGQLEQVDMANVEFYMFEIPEVCGVRVSLF